MDGGPNPSASAGASAAPAAAQRAARSESSVHALHEAVAFDRGKEDRGATGARAAERASAAPPPPSQPQPSLRSALGASGGRAGAPIAPARQASVDVVSRLGGAMAFWKGQASLHARRPRRVVDRPYEAMQPRGMIPPYEDTHYDSALRSALAERAGAHSEQHAEMVEQIAAGLAATRMRKPHRGAAVTSLAIARRVAPADSSGRGARALASLQLLLASTRHEMRGAAPSAEARREPLHLAGEEPLEEKGKASLAEFIVSGGAGGSLAVHDMATGNELCSVRHAHGAHAVLGLAVTPCSTQVISAGMDGALRRWRLEVNGLVQLGEADYRLHGAAPITAIALQPETRRTLHARGGSCSLVLSAGLDGRIALWRLDLMQTAPLRLLDAQQQPPSRGVTRALAFVPPPRRRTALSAGEVDGRVARALAADSLGGIVSLNIDLSQLTPELEPAPRSAGAVGAAAMRPFASDGGGTQASESPLFELASFETGALRPQSDAPLGAPAAHGSQSSDGGIGYAEPQPARSSVPAPRAHRDEEPVASCFISTHIVGRLCEREPAIRPDLSAHDLVAEAGGLAQVQRGSSMWLRGTCAISVSPGGGRLFTCGDDGRVIRWRLEREGPATLAGSPLALSSSEASPAAPPFRADGLSRRVATGSACGARPTPALAPPSSPVAASHADASRHAAGLVSFSMTRLDLVEAAHEHVFETGPSFSGVRAGAPHGVYAIADSFDGAVLITGGSDGRLRRFCTGSLVCEAAMTASAVDGEHGLEAGRLYIQRTSSTTRAEPGVSEHHDYDCPNRALPDDSPQLRCSNASLSDRYTLSHAVDEWSHRVRSDRAHGSVLQVAMPFGERADGLLASSGTDGLIRLWSTVTRGREPELVELGAVPNIEAFGEDGARSSDAMSTRRAPGSTDAAELHATEEAAGTSAVAAAAAGRDVADEACGIAARGLVFSPHDDMLFSADIAGNLLRWSVPALLNGMAARGSDGGARPTSSSAITPELRVAFAHGRARDGRALAVLALVMHEAGWGADALGCGGEGGSVLLSAGEVVDDAAEGGSSADAEGLRAASGGLRFWTLGLRHINAAVEPPLPGALHAAAFAKDGVTFVAAGPGCPSDISLWEARFVARPATADGGSGAQLRFVLSSQRACVNAHGGAPVRSIAASPDDARIVSAGADGHLRLWVVCARHEAQDRRTIELVALGDAVGDSHCQLAVNAAAFTPSGSQLVTGGADGALRTWPADWCLRAEGCIRRFDPPLLSGARESLFLSEDPGHAHLGNVPPRISRAALELAFGSAVVRRWLEGAGVLLEDYDGSVGGAASELSDDQAVERFCCAHASDHFWAEMTLLWPTRLAANAHALVLKAVASANHKALRQLLHVSAACDWGHPFAILRMRSGCSPADEPFEISALHLAIARADGESVRLLLRYMAKLKAKAHSLSTVLHVTDILLLLDRFPYMLAQFLNLLGLEAVHPAISESCRRAAVAPYDQWNRRTLRSAVPQLDSLFEFVGWRARVPAGGFISRSRAERDSPDVWSDMAVLSEQQTAAAPTIALRLGIKDVLACRDILPLIVYSRAATSLLQTPAAIALIDAKWSTYACRWFLAEVLAMALYVVMSLVFLLLSPFDEEDSLDLLSATLRLHHVSSIVGFAARLIVVINAMFFVRELLIWRLAARATGTAKTYLYDVWNLFDWGLIISSTCASCAYLRCAGRQATPVELLLGASPDARSHCQGHHGSSTSDWAAFATVMLAFRVLGMFRALPGMAEIVNMVTTVCIELGHFFVVMLTVILAFGLALYVRLSERSRKWWEDSATPRPCEWKVSAAADAPTCEPSDDYDSFTSVLVSAWGVMLGDFDVDNFQEQAVDVALFFSFTFLISVLMLNLIIAVISEHHARVTTIRVHAWRESLACTICDVDLLMNYWCAKSTASAACAERCGDRHAQASLASSRDVDYLSRKRRWKRLPIDEGACALEGAVSWEADAPFLSLALCAIGGAAIGSAVGSSVGVHIGARSAGASVAVPVGAIVACVLRTGSVSCTWLLRRCAPFAPSAAPPHVEAGNEYDGRAHVAGDCAMLLATAGAFCGAFVSYGASGVFGSPLASGACSCAVFCALFGAMRMTVRALFTLCVLLAEVVLLVSSAIAVGACVAFFVPAELTPRHLLRGGWVGGIVVAVLYAVSWLGGVAATASAFAWLWWPGDSAAECVLIAVGAGGTCAVLLLAHLLVEQVCRQQRTPIPAGLRPEAAAGQRPASPHRAACWPSSPSERARMAVIPSWARNGALHRTLALLSEGRRTLRSVGRALLAEVRDRRYAILGHCAAASGGSGAALLTAPAVQAMVPMEQEVRATFRVLLGTFIVACTFLAVESLSGLLRSRRVCSVGVKPAGAGGGARRYVPLLDDGSPPLAGLSGARGGGGRAAAHAAAENAEQPDGPSKVRLRWVHVLATLPTPLLGCAGRLLSELSD